MSARQVPLRESALAGALGALEVRGDQISRRARWPGASQLVSDRDSTSLPTALSSGASAPAPTWGTLLSMDLDPGCWLVVGAAVIVMTDESPAFRRCGIRVAGQTEAVRSYRVDSTGPVMTVGLQTHAIVDGDGGQVWLESFQQSYNTSAAAGGRTSLTFKRSLIAYPL